MRAKQAHTSLLMNNFVTVGDGDEDADDRYQRSANSVGPGEINKSYTLEGKDSGDASFAADCGDDFSRA